MRAKTIEAIEQAKPIMPKYRIDGSPMDRAIAEAHARAAAKQEREERRLTDKGREQLAGEKRPDRHAGHVKR